MLHLCCVCRPAFNQMWGKPKQYRWRPSAELVATFSSYEFIGVFPSTNSRRRRLLLLLLIVLLLKTLDKDYSISLQTNPERNLSNQSTFVFIPFISANSSLLINYKVIIKSAQMFTAKNSSATGSMVSDVILHLVSRRTHLLPVHTWLTMFAPLPSSPFFTQTTTKQQQSPAAFTSD